MRSLKEGIDNQLRTALSTLTGAFDMKAQLLNYKSNFFKKAQEQAKKQKFSGYVIDLSMDQTKALKLLDFLSLHNIKVKQLKSSITLKDKNFPAHFSYYIPLDQPQYTLINSLFSTQTSFEDNTFYDVSSWHLGMAWGLKYAQVKEKPETEEIQFKTIQNNYNTDAIAYAFNWGKGNAPAALNYLQQRDINTKVASKSFSIKSNGKTVEFKPGSIIIPTIEENRVQVLTAVANITEFFQVSSHALTNGLNEVGVDLGSPSIKTINKPRPLLIIGDGINAYQAGSIWHLFDTDVGLPLTKITKNQLKSIDLHNYSHLIFPSGNYFKKEDKTTEKIAKWVKQGGHLISLQKSANWAEKNLQKTEKKSNDNKSVQPQSYESYDVDLAKNTIGGAIVSATADLTHPLAYGMYQKIQFPLIKGNSLLTPSKNPYATPLRADKKALAAGYISDEKLKSINNNPLIIAEKSGKGTIIKFGFNPNFRGYWLGTQRWLINAMYFSELIKKTEIKK